MAKSPLDKIAGIIAKGFKGKLHIGALWRYTPGTGTLPNGDPKPGTWAKHGFEGIVDEYDDAYRATAGIPATDVKILIIAGSLSVEPRKDDVIHLRGAWYQARGPVKTDPAKAQWTVQGYATSKPQGVAP